MNRSELANYYDQPCRFKLRTGKEIFGVIWEVWKGSEVIYYFASAVERMRIKGSANTDDFLEKYTVKVLPEEIVLVEPIEEPIS
jgi:hypothetical protein